MTSYTFYEHQENGEHIPTPMFRLDFTGGLNAPRSQEARHARPELDALSFIRDTSHPLNSLRASLARLYPGGVRPGEITGPVETSLFPCFP